MADLIACYWTVAGQVVFGDHDESPWDFRVRAQAAARAGYRGIGLKYADLMKTIGKHGMEGVRAILQDNGLRHLEVEALPDWFADGDARRASDEMRRDLLNAAERLGARHLKAYGQIPRPDGEPDTARMNREFETLARQARDAGTIAAIEPMVCSVIADLSTALQVLGDSAGCGGGLMLDAWHVIRGNMPFADIAKLQSGWIACVEIDDGPKVARGNYLWETLNQRLLCGEGEFDLPGFIAAVRATGYDGPWGVEIISEAQRALTLEEAAVRSFDAAKRQFD